MLGKPVQLWNSWMILQGKAVRFLYLLLRLLRFFILIEFKIRACFAISDFSHAISPSPYLSLKKDGGEGKGQRIQNVWGVVLRSQAVDGRREQLKEVVWGWGCLTGLWSWNSGWEEALLGPSGALLLVLLERPRLASEGPGLCLFLLPVVVILL